MAQVKTLVQTGFATAGATVFILNHVSVWPQVLVLIEYKYDREGRLRLR